MNAQVSPLNEARVAEAANLPPLTERPTRPASVAPVRKKKRGRALLLILAVIALGFGVYTLVKGRLAQGNFFRTEQSAVPKPDPMKILQDRVAELEATRKAGEDNNSNFEKTMAADLNTLRGTIGMLPTGEDIAGLRLQLEQTRGSVDRHAVRLTSIEGAEQSRRVVQAERTQQQAIKTLEASVTLPFRVLALDRWGGKPYVTVAPPGVNVLETMGVGDKRAGWELKTVDARGGNVTFTDQNGHNVTKTVEER
jgi:hypothetical protein